MPKIKKRGTGMTAKSVIEYDLTDEKDTAEAFDRLKSWAAEWNSGANDFERMVPHLDNWIEKTLNGDYPDGEDSPKDFAQRIQAALAATRNSIEQGNAATAAQRAYLLGRLVESAVMKAVHEPTWKAGAQKIEALARGRKKGVEMRQIEAEKRRDAMRKMNTDLLRDEPEWSQAQRIRHIQKRVTKLNGGVYSESQIRRVIGE